MYPVARLLQFIALTILPLVVVAQLANQISAGQMLRFLVFAICLFIAGYLIQQFSAPRS